MQLPDIRKVLRCLHQLSMCSCELLLGMHSSCPLFCQLLLCLHHLSTCTCQVVLCLYNWRPLFCKLLYLARCSFLG